jgi:membrane protein
MTTTATENKFIKLPIIKQLVFLLQKIKLPWLHGLSLFDLLDLYFVGIIEGALSYRAAAIAWSFFMALFPFMLFIFNLIPYIPIEGFQDDFLGFVQQSVPPTTYDAIFKIKVVCKNQKKFKKIKFAV